MVVKRTFFSCKFDASPSILGHFSFFSDQNSSGQLSEKFYVQLLFLTIKVQKLKTYLSKFANYISSNDVFEYCK